jgi:hypothetical protein
MYEHRRRYLSYIWNSSFQDSLDTQETAVRVARLRVRMKVLSLLRLQDIKLIVLSFVSLFPNGVTTGRKLFDE